MPHSDLWGAITTLGKNGGASIGILLVLLIFSSMSIAQESSVTVKDIDGSVYKTVVIGTQIWMKENLKTTKYNDGTPIPNVTDGTQWESLTTGAYSWLNNVAATEKNFFGAGALYNWYAVETGKLCPAGWHIPSNAEWTTLTTYLGGGWVAGGKLKETGTTHWGSSNTGASNESGFTALPGGVRWDDRGMFRTMTIGHWWSSTTTHDQAWSWIIFSGQDAIKSTNTFDKKCGFSVRCLKD